MANIINLKKVIGICHEGQTNQNREQIANNKMVGVVHFCGSIDETGRINIDKAQCQKKYETEQNKHFGITKK